MEIFRKPFDANLVFAYKYTWESKRCKEPDRNLLRKIQFSIWIKSINFKIFAFENRALVCSLKSEKKNVPHSFRL